LNKFDSINFKKIILENIKSDTFPEKKYHIYEILDGRIYTDSVENVAIIKNDTIIPNISYQQINSELKSSEFNKVLKIGTPRIKKKFKGTVLSMVQGASGNNYFHFLFDIIVRLKICEEKYNLSSINYFYVTNELNWQKKIFSLFGIEKEKLINSEKYRHIQADKIIAVDHPWYHKGKVHDEVKNIPSWIVLWLRNKFLNMAKKFDNNEKIFIDRSESRFKHCQFQNNDEIISFLKTKGFTSYKVGQLDFFEQIYLFNKAKIIIGPHGAAFTNIIFCNPKTNIVEILPESHPSQKCTRLCKILNLNHLRISTPELSINEKKFGDIRFDIGEMDKLIKKIT
tara:strand:+ start:113 stop:1132 length:1020 start_codon:yes stop_codon:yes gene_type:complete